MLGSVELRNMKKWKDDLVEGGLWFIGEKQLMKIGVGKTFWITFGNLHMRGLGSRIVKS